MSDIVLFETNIEILTNCEESVRFLRKLFGFFNVCIFNDSSQIVRILVHICKYYLKKSSQWTFKFVSKLLRIFTSVKGCEGIVRLYFEDWWNWDIICKINIVRIL